MSIYDKIISLPLLRGAGSEALNFFLEKTALDFNTVDPGEPIMSLGEASSSLLCLVSGRMKITHHLFAGDMIIHEERGEGSFVGVERLFGMDNRIPYEVTALERCGTLKVAKQQYMDLLREDKIFLLNCLNYLSHSGQKYEDMLTSLVAGSSLHLLAAITNVVTQRHSSNVVLETFSSSFIDFLKSMSTDIAGYQRFLSIGLLREISERSVAVPDRNAFIDAALDS